MASTLVSTSDNLTKKIWERELYEDTRKESYFLPRFAGKSAENAVQEQTDLSKKGAKGDNVTFGMIPRLGASFIEDGQSEGNENALSSYDYNVSLHLWRIPVNVGETELDRKRPIYDLESEGRTAIKINGAENLDQKFFDQLTPDASSSNAPTRAIQVDASSTATVETTASTAKGNLADGDDITPDAISWAKTYALTGGDRSFTPIRPIRVAGKSYLVLLVHPDVLYDLAINDTMEKAHREARDRSKENPIFTGSDFIWNGVVIHSHENVHTGTDGGGASVAWAANVMFGAQALLMAWGRRPKIVKGTSDYKQKIGYDWSMVGGVAKPQFNSEDYGSMGFYTARTQVSDA